MVFEKEKPEDFNSSIGMECTKRAINYCAANKQYRLIDEWYKMSNAAHHDANYQVDEGTRTFLLSSVFSFTHWIWTKTPN